ncbi:MAG: hypothetical protein ACI936_000046 [Paraglaciecola sp.]|jgi:hypothetical protein
MLVIALGYRLILLSLLSHVKVFAQLKGHSSTQINIGIAYFAIWSVRLVGEFCVAFRVSHEFFTKLWV